MLDPDDIVIHNGGGQPNDGEINFGDGTILFAEGTPGTFDISELAVEGIGAPTNILFQANNSITISDLTDNVLDLAPNGTVMFSTGAGGFIMDPTDEILLTGGAALTIDATLGAGSGSVMVGSITGFGGNVDIIGTNVDVQGIIVLTWGDIDLTATLGDVDLAGASTDTGSYNLTAFDHVTITGDVDVTTGTGQVNIAADTNGDGTGTFSIADLATVTKNGTNVFTISAADIDFQSTGAMDAGLGQIQVDVTVGNISIGTSTSNCGGACEMVIDASELSRITAADNGPPSLIVGDNTHADIFIGPLVPGETDAIGGNVFIQSGGSVTVEGAATFNDVSLFADQGVFVNFDLTADDGDIALDGDNDGNLSHVIGVNNGVTIDAAGVEGFMNLISRTDVTSGSGGATFIADGTIQISDDFDSTGQTGLVQFLLDFDGSGFGNFNAINGANLTFDTAEVVIVADDFVIGAAGSISGTNRLKIEPGVMVTSIGVGQFGDMTLDATEIGLITNGFAVGLTIGVAGYTGSIDIGTITFNDPVEFLAPGVGGAINVDGTLTGLDDADFFFDGPGATTTLNADVITAGNPIVFNDSITLGSAGTRTIDTTNLGGVAAGASVTIDGAVDDDILGTTGLVINAGTGGIVTLNDDIGVGIAPAAFTVLNSDQTQLFDVISNGGMSITATDIFLDGNTYTSNASTIAFNGIARVNSPGTRTVTAGGGSITANEFDLINGLLDLQTNTTVGTLMLDDGDLALNHTTTTVTDLIFLRGSTVTGSANVDVSNQFNAQIFVGAAAQSTWNVTGTLTLASSAMDHLFAAGQNDTLIFTGAGAVINNGTLNITGAPGDIGSIRFEAGFGLINNGVIDILDDIDIFDDNVTPGTLTNTNSIVKSGGTLESFFEMILVNSAGSVDVQAGELSFNVGGSGTLGGNYQIGVNALSLTGGHNLDGTTSITGSTGGLTVGGGTTIAGSLGGFSGDLFGFDGGTDNINSAANLNSVVVDDGGTLNLNTATTIATTLTVQDGTLVAPSLTSVGGSVTVVGSSTLDIDTDITFVGLNMAGGGSSAGTLTGAANVIVSGPFDAQAFSGGAFIIDIDVPSLTLNGTSTINLGQNKSMRFDGTAVTNNGNWTSTALDPISVAMTFQNGASFNNANGSNLVLAGGMDVLNAGAAGGFLNDGTVTKLGTDQTDFGLVITNNDTFDIQDGRMRVTTSLANDDDIMVTGNGIFEVTDGNTFTNNLGGTLSGEGTFDGPSITGIVNNGFAGPGLSPGIMNVIGDFTFGNGSQFNVELESSANNPGVSHDQLDVTGNVTIDPGATLNLTTTGGYTGVVNDMFDDVINATGTVNGEFDTVLQPGTLIADTTYTVGAPGDLSLTVAATGTINQWILAGSGLFNTGGNWSMGVPTGAHDTFIGIGGVTVTHSSGVSDTVSTLSLVGSSTLSMTSGSLTVNNDSILDGNLTLAGGSLIGPTNLTVNGLVNWSSGTMSGAGTTTANGGVSVTTGTQTLSGQDLNSLARILHEQ